MFILIIFLPHFILGMELIEDKKIQLSDKPINVSSKTYDWLYQHSHTLKSMKEDITDDGQALSLAGISASQFNLLKTKIIDKESTTFQQLCRGPLAKDLVEMLYVTDSLEIKELQTAIVTELAQRYYQFPSLARRHTNASGVSAKYVPQFKSNIETLVAKGLYALSCKNVLCGKIECLKVIRESINSVCLTYDKKQIIGEQSKNVFRWDAATGELASACTFKSLFNFYRYNDTEYLLKAVVNASGTYMVGNDGSSLIFMCDTGANILKMVKSRDFVDRIFFQLNNRDCDFSDANLVITPDNKKIIVKVFNEVGILKNMGIYKGKDKWETKYIPLGSCDRFNIPPCITQDGKYLVFSACQEIRILDLDNIDRLEKRIDVVNHEYKKTKCISSLVLTPDESRIIVGIYENSNGRHDSKDNYKFKNCKTYLKIFDFTTRKLLKTIYVSDHGYYQRRISSKRFRSHPYDCINAITVTPDGTKIIVASQSSKAKIIDLETDQIVQEIGEDPYLPSINPTSDVHKNSSKSFLGINADGTKIIAGYKPLAIYGNPEHEQLAACLCMQNPLQQMLKILSMRKKH